MSPHHNLFYSEQHLTFGPRSFSDIFTPSLSKGPTNKSAHSQSFTATWAPGQALTHSQGSLASLPSPPSPSVLQREGMNY